MPLKPSYSAGFDELEFRGVFPSVDTFGQVFPDLRDDIRDDFTVGVFLSASASGKSD